MYFGSCFKLPGVLFKFKLFSLLNVNCITFQLSKVLFLLFIMKVLNLGGKLVKMCEISSFTQHRGSEKCVMNRGMNK